MINPSGTNNVIDYANTIDAPSVFNFPNPSSDFANCFILYYVSHVKKKKKKKTRKLRRYDETQLIDIKNKDASSWLM